jgi:hypothetical protein
MPETRNTGLPRMWPTWPVDAHYACIAVSACHLSRTANTIAPDVADSYHERCISIMLPVLDKPEFDIGIDILLSSTVILRFFEQISCTFIPN